MLTSVALCTFNGEKYIASQLQSILEQTIAVNEIIICDDCSTDNTISVVNSFIQQHPSIISLHINEKNLGGKIDISNFRIQRSGSQGRGNDIFARIGADSRRQARIGSEFTSGVRRDPRLSAVVTRSVRGYLNLSEATCGWSPRPLKPGLFGDCSRLVEFSRDCSRLVQFLSVGQRANGTKREVAAG